jgi:hypothetical protein
VLSSAAASTLVTLVTTDGWERVKAAFAGLWRRYPRQAESVDADLTALRSEVISARRAGGAAASGFGRVNQAGRDQTVIGG